MSQYEFHHRGVIDHGIDPIGGRRIDNELDIYQQRLRNAPLMFPNADDDRRFESVDGDLHAGFSSAMAQRGRVAIASGSMAPATSSASRRPSNCSNRPSSGRKTTMEADSPWYGSSTA